MHLKKKLLILLALIMFVISVIIGLCLRKGTTNFAFINTPDAVDKIRFAEKQGESVELQEKDINSILGGYIGKGRNKGSVTVKGIKAACKEEMLSLEIHVKYKGIPLLISTSGKCTYLSKENKIQYKANYYKLGSMPIPKSIAQSILRNHESRDFQVNNSSVKVYLPMFPSSMKDATISKNNVKLSLNKNDSVATIFPKLVGTDDSLAVTTENPTSKLEEIPDNIAYRKAFIASEETKRSLSKINSNLSNANGELKSAKEKEVLKRMINTIDSVSENLDYNYASDVSEITSRYNKLTAEGKNRINLAIMSNENMDTATKIKNTFGF